MPAVESTMLALGTAAPDFQLPDVRTGMTVSLASFADRRALIVTFICRHCPYVQAVKDELARLGRDYQACEVGMVGINPNDIVAYPEDAPASLAEMAEETGFTFPWLHDESQDVARAYSAACTPDNFVFDAARRLVYRGQLDGARPGNGLASDGADIRAALDALLAGQPVPQDQRPSIGCSIKWRAT